MDSPLARRTQILLVEDDAKAARLMSRLLQEDGFDVEVAVDGTAAISRLSKDPLPDILVTDLKVPHADGEAIIGYGRSRNPSLSVVIVTSYPAIASRVKGQIVPIPPVFTKPIEYQELAKTLREIANAQKKP